MSESEVVSVFDPLAIVKRWQTIPNTLSHKVVNGTLESPTKAFVAPAGPTAREKLMNYVATLPEGERAVFLAKAAARRAEKLNTPKAARVRSALAQIR